jgi:hypothetical protein
MQSVRVILSIGLLATVVSADINLQSFRSANVRNWSYAPTAVESVWVNTAINSGIATTSLTFTLEPGPYQQVTYKNVVVPETTWVVKDTLTDKSSPQIRYRTQSLPIYSNPVPIDSIEISNNMYLPQDWVAKEMYLWIDGEKVPAYIQDRALASAQYEQIVNRRRDPALLEFSGNGSYNLRIFPAKSFEARKIEIVFQHTLDDDTLDQISAHLPLVYDTTHFYSYSSEQRYRSVGYMQVSLSASDGRQYGFTMPGIGSGVVSSKKLVLEAKNITRLQSGLIVCKDPSGEKEYLFAGADKAGAAVVGGTVWLAESTVALEPEPATRIIVVDIRDEWWDWDTYYRASNTYSYSDREPYVYDSYKPVNIWERGQKMALASLLNYVNGEQKFNLIIAGKTINSVFTQPVSPTADNLKTAFTALINARPDAGASTLTAMQTAVAQANGGIVILISDLYQPYNYIHYSYTASGAYTGNEKSADGIRFDTLISTIGSVVTKSRATLFTIADDWQLTAIAANSGGFNLASLRWDYWMRYETYTDVKGAVRYKTLLPRLFLDRGGISDLVVTSPQISDISFTIDNPYQGRMYMIDDVMMRADSRAVAKDAVAIAPWYWRQSTSGMLRLAGHTAGAAKAAAIAIQGKMGGRAFTKTVQCLADDIDLTTTNVQLAFRQTEQLACDWSNWQKNADVIKKIGLANHIVTRQTSLLALEKGMDLWKDTVVASQGDRGISADFAAVPEGSKNSAIPSNAVSLDGISMEEMMNQELVSVNPEPPRPAAEQIRLAVQKRTFVVSLPKQLTSETAAIALYDVKGRLIMSRMVTPAEIVNGQIAISRNGLSNTVYILSVKIGAVQKSLRFTLTR